MTSEYNLSGPRSVTKVGNWLEEQALQGCGSAARVAGAESAYLDTFERVAPNSRSSNSLKLATTVARDQQADVLRGRPAPVLGPRALRLQAAIGRDAELVATRAIEPVPPPPTLESHAAATFKAHAHEAYHAPPPRWRPLTAQTVALLAAARPVDVDRLGVTLDRRAYAAEGGGDALLDAPVTIYSMRLPEGAFHGVTAVRGLHPFGKSTAFTNPISEGHKVHAEANDSPDMARVTPLGSTLKALAGGGISVAARAPGAEVTMQALWTHFLRKLGFAAGAHTGLPWLVAALCAPAPPPPASASGGTSGASVSMDGFRAAVQSLAVPVSHREVEAVMASCEPAGLADAVSLDLLVDHAASTLVPPRQAAVRAIFDAIARGGSVGVAELAARFRPEATAQARVGGAPPKDILEAFLGFFIELGCDRDVPRSAFEAWHAGASASADSDGDFLCALENEWGWRAAA